MNCALCYKTIRAVTANLYIGVSHYGCYVDIKTLQSLQSRLLSVLVQWLMWHTQSSKDRSSIPKICKVKMQIVPLLKSYTFDFLMFSILKILNLMLLHELAILLLYVVMKFKPMTSLSCLIFICRNHFRTARFRESATPAILERGRGEPCPRPLARSKL